MNISAETAMTLAGVIFNAGILLGGFYSLKKDVGRLEKKQEESNKVKERVWKLEANDEAQWRWIDEFKEKAEIRK